MLKVTYDVKNISEKDYLVGQELALYVNGKKMSSYPIESTIETISANRSIENAVAAFGVNGDKDFELEVAPSFDISGKKEIVKLDLN